MPIYEYKCKKCEAVFEVLLKSTEPEPGKCEECGSKRIGRVMSQTSFVLKGSGWYQTDYGNSSKGGSSSSTKSSDSSGKDD
jgi:putative FmdB family regulatory protein